MHLKSLELSGFKSFGKKAELTFDTPITSIVGPNGSGKSNVAESFRFVLGEQSMKTLRGKKGEDLIWNGSPAVPRAGRASITITFDNRGRFLNTDFDEVSIERVVNRDGVNEYKINGSAVRLRDVTELLAGANIGSSGHHIISQGEADRVLSANPKERREMIEDALGLRVYQYKKRESERKLEKTEENKKQVEALRKENAPHLRFLERQIEKLKKTEALREELAGKYLRYLKQEELLITYAKESLHAEHDPLVKKEATLALELESARDVLKQAEASDKNSEVALSLEKELTDIRKVRDTLGREIGRLEGEMSALRRRGSVEEGGSAVPWKEINALFESMRGEFDDALQKEHVAGVKEVLRSIRDRLSSFVSRYATAKAPDSSEQVAALESEKAALIKKEEGLWKREEELLEEIKTWRESRSAEREKARHAERDMFQILTQQGELRSKLATLRAKQEGIKKREEAFQMQVREGIALVGARIREYRVVDMRSPEGTALSPSDIVAAGDVASEVRLKELEKLKIRVEESGAGNGEDVAKEYSDAKARDEFLEKELADLERSAESLRVVIVDLTQKLDHEFHAGVEKITKEFSRFFETMFGSGSASLTLVTPPKKKKKSEFFDTEELPEESEEEGGDTREGVEVTISLPHKRIKGLEMLSGGERALTSIALIFAMSQVNPPPFLILDETDAALDEANSRRYGDMISELAKKSQLILITHNRETMSRAGVLYGVTMGADGVSKLLSVKFEEAVKVAK